MISKIFLIAFLSIPLSYAKLKVVTSTTDLAWVAQQIGKDQVSAEALLTGSENAHYIETRPDYIVKVSNADIVCGIGLELEIGWLPKVLEKSGNSKVQSGGTGFCETGNRVAVLEKPVGAIDRSQGDIHPYGNPHFWLSPIHLAQAAEEIRDVLTKNDSAHSAFFQSNYETLKKSLVALVETNKKKFKSLKNPLVAEYHKEFSYFLEIYHLPSIGSLEEKPGVPPSAGRILAVAQEAKNKKVKVLLGATFSPLKTLEKFSELSGVPFIALPLSVNSDHPDYIKLHQFIADQIFNYLSKP